jgi:hypothetical protein
MKRVMMWDDAVDEAKAMFGRNYWMSQSGTKFRVGAVVLGRNWIVGEGRSWRAAILNAWGNLDRGGN